MNVSEPYLLNGFSYSEAEMVEVREIRSMPDGDHKIALIKCFEVERGKAFPAKRAIKLGYNHSKAHQSSLEIEKGAAFIATHMLESRRCLSLD
jgi:hypothetical protein